MILVTGATGHLGANLVRQLLDDGRRVRVLLRKASNNTAVDGLDVERAFGDLRDPAAVQAAVRGCERIYHCAAKISTTSGGEREIYETNVAGTRHVLAAGRAAGVRRVVVTGSFSAVGHVEGRPSHEGDAFDPFSHVLPYERSKAWVEHECLKAVVEGLDVVIAISCAIIGPHDYKPSRMGRVICDFARGRLRAYIPGGFEFVAARDIVQGHLLAMERGRAGQRYIFSTEFMTVDRLMAMLEQITGRRRPRLRLPPALMAAIASVASPVMSAMAPAKPQRLTPGAVRLLRMNRRAECAKAKQELGYRPSSIESALRDAHAWFAATGAIAASGSGARAPLTTEEV